MRKRGRVVTGPRGRSTCKKTKMMSAEESEDLFRQYLTRKETHAHTELNRQAQDLQQGMLKTKGQGQGRGSHLQPSDAPAALTWRGSQQVVLRAEGNAQTGALTTQKLSTLMSTEEVPMHDTGLLTVAQSLGLRHKPLDKWQRRSELRRQERRVQSGHEFETRRQVAINLAQAGVLTRLFQSLCLQILQDPPTEYQLPPHRGLPDEDPEHHCLHSEKNCLPCNMISVKMPADGTAGRLHFCTVTGHPHFCSRLTCEYFTRMKRESHDVCALTGACFNPLPSSGLSYLSVNPSMRAWRKEDKDDEDFDLPQYTTNRDKRQKQSQTLRSIVAGLKRKDHQDRTLEEMQREHRAQEHQQAHNPSASPPVLTPQMARQWDQRLHGNDSELPTAEKVHCAVQANTKDPRLKQERLTTFRQEIIHMLKVYYGLSEYREAQLDELVDICEKTWVLLTASEAYMRQTMSYQVARHPYVVLDLCASSGMQPTIKYEQPCEEEPGVIEIVVEDVTLIPICPWLCPFYRPLVSFATTQHPRKKVQWSKLSKRFRDYMRCLTADPARHSILRALHASYEDTKHN